MPTAAKIGERNHTEERNQSEKLQLNRRASRNRKSTAEPEIGTKQKATKEPKNDNK